MVAGVADKEDADGTRRGLTPLSKSATWLLLTRPGPRARPLQQALRRRGVDCCSAPLLATRRCRRSERLTLELTEAASAARRVFVSPAAVDAIQTLAPGLLGLPAAAVGPTTAAALTAARCPSVWLAASATGIDGLFELANWRTLAGERVCVFNARGGRLPSSRCIERLDLRIRPITVYQRQRLRPPVALQQRLRRHWREVVFSASSVALLEALAELLCGLDLTAALQRPLLTLSERIAGQATALGFTQVLVLPDFSTENLLHALAAERAKGLGLADDHA